MLHRSSIARESRQVAWSLVVIAIVGLIPFRLGVKASPAPAAQTPAGTRTAPASPVPVREPISEPPNAVDGRRELAAQIEEHARALGTLRQAAEEITQGRTRDEAGRATEAMRQQIEELSGRFNPESLEAYVRETQDALRVLAEETAREQAIEARPTQREDTEAFLRAQIAELRARLEKVAKEDLERNADALEQFRRRLASDAQAVAAERRIAEEVRDRSKSLTTQLDVLREQQQALMRQMEQIAEQQKVLADMQQRIAEETQRLREALKPR